MLWPCRLMLTRLNSNKRHRSTSFMCVCLWARWIRARLNLDEFDASALRRMCCELGNPCFFFRLLSAESKRLNGRATQLRQQLCLSLSLTLTHALWLRCWVLCCSFYSVTDSTDSLWLVAQCFCRCLSQSINQSLSLCVCVCVCVCLFWPMCVPQFLTNLQKRALCVCCFRANNSCFAVQKYGLLVMDARGCRSAARWVCGQPPDIHPRKTR